MKLSYLITTRNREVALERCLSSIVSDAFPETEIVVVDDASIDGTAGMVRRAFPQAALLRSDVQLGVGGARALGMPHVTGDVIVCLDDDAYLASAEAGRRIEERFVATPELGALCFRVEAPDGSVRRSEIPLREKRLPDHDTEIGYFLGGAVAYRTEAVRRVGAFASDIAYGSDELDLAYRMFAAGYRTLFTPTVRVVHEAIASPENVTHREANYARNRIRVAARNLPAPYAHVHALLWAGTCMWRGMRDGSAAEVGRAVADGLRGWGAARAQGRMLTREQVRRLGKLSGRTWY